MNLAESDCRSRQAALAKWLRTSKADAVWLSDPRHLMYLFNEYGRPIHPATALITADGRSTIVRPDFHTVPVFADEILTYSPGRLSTLVEDPAAEAAARLDRFANLSTIAVDIVLAPSVSGNRRLMDAGPALRQMRRQKYADEIAVIQHAVTAGEAGYAAARDRIAPGVSELSIFTACHEAAVLAAGEAIGELGNDFRGGAMGGSPRPDALRAGDLLPIDAGVVVRHYNSDLCRTFAVSGRRTDAQRAAAEKVAEALELAERLIEPGRSCAEVYHRVREKLDGWRQYHFPHHLGHGIGLSPHEAPRINPHWNDSFAIGDAFTLEPGLYGDELRAGVRTEQNYVLLEAGLRRLSSFELNP